MRYERREDARGELSEAPITLPQLQGHLLRVSGPNMSIRVLVKDHPHRTIALATEDHAVVLRHSPSAVAQGSTSSLQSQQSGGQSASRCLVEFSPLASLDLTGYRSLRSALGTLGLITLEKDVFVCVITGSSQVATVRPGETVQRIHSVEFCKLGIIAVNVANTLIP